MTDSKIIIGLVGDLAAGKGTVCAYLAKQYGARSHRFSTMLRDILDRLYVAKTRENLQQLSTVLRATFGQDVMSRVIAEDASHDPGGLVAVEGIRRPSDITHLRQLPGFHLVYITAEPELRWRRLVARAENPGDRDKTFADFKRDEQAEADRLIAELGRESSFTITNNGTFAGLYSQVEQILTKLKSSAP